MYFIFLEDYNMSDKSLTSQNVEICRKSIAFKHASIKNHPLLVFQRCLRSYLILVALLLVLR